MEEQKLFRMKLWMWISLLVAVVLIIFNSDPVGDGLEKLFGAGADRWAINIVIVCVAFYLLFFGRKK